MREWTAGALLLVLLAGVPCLAETGSSRTRCAPQPHPFIGYAEVGYGRATLEFQRPDEPTLTRSMIDFDAGLRRAIGMRGALRLGSSASLMLVPDRPLEDSYSCLALDLLVLEGSFRRLRARAGFGLLRMFAPVHELTAALSAGLAGDLGPVFVGVKGRAARFEVDFEPHGGASDTKYNFLYAAFVIGRSWPGE